MSRLPSYYNMCFPRVQSLKFCKKNWMLPMFKKPQNLKALTLNLVLGLFNLISTGGGGGGGRVFPPPNLFSACNLFVLGPVSPKSGNFS